MPKGRCEPLMVQGESKVCTGKRDEGESHSPLAMGVASEMTQRQDAHKRQTRHNSGWRKKEVLKQAAVYFYKAP